MTRNLFLEDSQYEQMTVKSHLRAGSMENSNSCRVLDNCRQVQDQIMMFKLGSSTGVGKNHHDDQSTIYSSSQTSSPTNNSSPIKCFESEKSTKEDDVCCITPDRQQRYSLDSTYTEESSDKSKSHQLSSLKHLIEAEEELQSIWKNNLPKKAISKPIIISNQKLYTTSSKSNCLHDDVKISKENVNNDDNYFVNPEQHTTSLQQEDLQKQLQQLQVNRLESLTVNQSIPERCTNPFSKYESLGTAQKLNLSSPRSQQQYQLSCKSNQQLTTKNMKSDSFAMSNSLNNQDILSCSEKYTNNINKEQSKYSQPKCTDVNLINNNQYYYGDDDYMYNTNYMNYYSLYNCEEYDQQYNMYSFSSTDSEEQQIFNNQYYQFNSSAVSNMFYQSTQLNYQPQFVNDIPTFQNDVHITQQTYNNNLTQSTY